MKSNNKEYTLPKVSDYIKDKELCNAIDTYKQSPFIKLKNKDYINNISYNDYSDILVYGIQKSGKSTFLENALINILLKTNPKDTKVLIIDTKVLQYRIFNGLEHLLCPVATDILQALKRLDKIIKEIDRRYSILIDNQVKSIEKYNSIKDKEDKIPSIIVMIDDLSDLMEYSKKEVTEMINIILQKFNV